MTLGWDFIAIFLEFHSIFIDFSLIFIQNVVILLSNLVVPTQIHYFYFCPTFGLENSWFSLNFMTPDPKSIISNVVHFLRLFSRILSGFGDYLEFELFGHELALISFQFHFDWFSWFISIKFNLEDRWLVKFLMGYDFRKILFGLQFIAERLSNLVKNWSDKGLWLCYQFKINYLNFVRIWLSYLNPWAAGSICAQIRWKEFIWSWKWNWLNFSSAMISLGYRSGKQCWTMIWLIFGWELLEKIVFTGFEIKFNLEVGWVV